MLTFRSAALAAVLWLFAIPALAHAQIDYRNLDDERPVQTEDAYVIERYAFELMLPTFYEAGRLGSRRWLVAPEMAYGILSDVQVGVKAPFAFTNETLTGDGFAGPRLFALYNFNTEGGGLPAFLLRADLSLPFGALAGDTPQFTLKGVATRSWGLTRAHLNLSRSFGRESGRGAVEAPSRWFGSLAVDRTLYRQSLLFIGELTLQQNVRGASVATAAGVGVRYQWTPTIVLDVGFARSIDNGADHGVTVGVSHAFAIAGLLPRGGR